MNTADLDSAFEDNRPFVIEACGDSMWDEVLAQPAYNASLRPPLPPFTRESALQKVQLAEDTWNTKDPEKVSFAYTIDTELRNRTEFINGREAVKAFLVGKWNKEFDYILKKELWDFHENRIAVRFDYEWHDSMGQWYRSYGNELWEFAETGLMQKRFASINDLPIRADERRLGIPQHPNS